VGLRSVSQNEGESLGTGGRPNAERFRAMEKPS
jgi:hypothetical protein